jgi:glucose-1-phosphate adenylyltransferase
VIDMATTDRLKPSPRFVSRLTKNTFGLVLAGGRGSRLKHLTD